MSFTAFVENDTIKLPPGVHLPDGTKVHIAPTEQSPNVETDSLWAFMEQFAGCVKSGIGDLSENHDHYAHGAPKGIDRL